MTQNLSSCHKHQNTKAHTEHISSCMALALKTAKHVNAWQRIALLAHSPSARSLLNNLAHITEPTHQCRRVQCKSPTAALKLSQHMKTARRGDRWTAAVHGHRHLKTYAGMWCVTSMMSLAHV